MERREFIKAGLMATGAATVPDVLNAESRRVPDKDYALSGNRLTVDWPQLGDSLRFWVIGDTHFGFHDVRDDAFKDNYARMARFGAKKEPFEAMLAKARKEKPDLLVFVGDNISFPTLANVEYLKAALDGCEVPWLYVAGNHDWHFEGDAGSDFEQRARWTANRLKPLYQGANPLMASRVVKGVRFVMIDNSLYHVLPEQLAFYEAEVAKGDPVCLAMHIPIWHAGWDIFTCGCPTWGAATDPYWKIERRERWAERLLPSTFAFRDAVLKTSNLVGAFAGHVHVLQVARDCGQNFFSVPANSKGAFLDVTVSTKI